MALERSKHVTHVLAKLGAADRTEAGTARASGPWFLAPHPSRPGNTFG